jgi:hypothetical protein
MRASHCFIGPGEELPISVAPHKQADIVKLLIVDCNYTFGDRPISVQLDRVADAGYAPASTFDFLQVRLAVVDGPCGIRALERELRRKNRGQPLAIAPVFGIADVYVQFSKRLFIVL